MKKLCCLTTFLLIAPCFPVKAQVNVIAAARADDRLPLLWEYCQKELIADKAPSFTGKFFSDMTQTADSLGDQQLKRYTALFSNCYLVLFSQQYEKHFPVGGYKDALALLAKTEQWAIEHKYKDIEGICEAYTGQVYYDANHYGNAFEHLLKSDQLFSSIGYNKVSNIAYFLYLLGLHFYQFEEYDKALEKLLQSAEFRFYLPRTEINALTAIGSIYARRNKQDSAMFFFRETINKAKLYNDQAWVGIGLGNVGNVFLALRQYDSSIFYHKKSFAINSDLAMTAPEDAAKCAIYIADAYVEKHQPDSALAYINKGLPLAKTWITDTADILSFQLKTLYVMVKYYKLRNEFVSALTLTDSITRVENRLRILKDNRAISRAIEKNETIAFDNSLALLKSEKNASQFRLYFVIAVLMIGLLLLAFIYHDRSLRNQRMMQLAEKDRQLLLAEKQLAEEGLKHSRNLLNAYIDTVKEKSLLINQLETELSYAKKNNHDHTDDAAASKEQLLARTLLTDTEWQQFRELFEHVYPGFTFRMKEQYPELSPAEARFIYLTKLSLSSREMATMLGVTIDAIHKMRYRLRKKLNLEEATGFESVLQKIA